MFNLLYIVIEVSCLKLIFYDYSFEGVAVFITFYLALTRLVTAAGCLHDNMLSSVIRSPMSFFDTVPLGRILNR